MKIVVQEPVFLFNKYKEDFNGYKTIFLNKHVSGIYSECPKRMVKYIIAMLKNGINPFKFEYFHDSKKFNGYDVFLNLNGKPFLEFNKLPKIGSSILKAYHIMDYADKAILSNQALCSQSIDFLFGYARHDKYCDFFNKYYTDFYRRVISVPFGYSNKYNIFDDDSERYNKVLAIGAINNITEQDSEIIKVFPNEKYSHLLREFVRYHNSELSFFDSFLPSKNNEKTPNVDMRRLLKSYKYFLNDLSLFNFPPARTYEGIASGSILVGLEHDVYKELGFENNVNCILLNEISRVSFSNIESIIANSNKDDLVRNSMSLAREFSHDKIVSKMYNDIKNKTL
ncbi:hypothetical protein [Aliivibrio fischeri]|uniref:hypothetical protein n=1 Tax=Aliivibrio fischeri TaxID=668 RepID=UPI0007C4818B|nr:hypothetical protein [Aliivibrio fischeri]